MPPVLLSGNHAHIARWRRDQSLMATARLRPDLLEQARLQDGLQSVDEQLFGWQAPKTL